MQKVQITSTQDMGGFYKATCNFLSGKYASKVRVTDILIDKDGHHFKITDWDDSAEDFKQNGVLHLVNADSFTGMPANSASFMDSKIGPRLDITYNDSVVEYTLTASDIASPNTTITIPGSRKYEVGSGDMEVYINGVKLIKGDISTSYVIQEVGEEGSLSSELLIKGTEFSEGSVLQIVMEQTNADRRYLD